MKSIESGVSPSSDYYVYAPSRTAQSMFFYPLQCGMFEYAPGYHLERSSFDSFLLMYLQKGSMTLDCGGKRQTIPEKCFALIDCYLPHGYSTASGCTCLWLHFDGVLARKYCGLITSRLGQVFSMGDDRPVLRILQGILDAFRNSRQVREPLLSRYINDMLTEFMLLQPERKQAALDDSAVNRAIGHMNEHFVESVTVQTLASTAGLSPCHFIRVFRQKTGYTPHEYLVNLRMASARYLLKYTTLSVKEICFNTGFASESVFCNAFRKQHQLSPQQYRLSGAEHADNARQYLPEDSV